MFPSDHARARATEVVDIIHKFHNRGWSDSTSTNYSFRNPEDPEEVFISQSGISKDRFTVGHFMVIDHKGQAIYPKKGRPSAETFLHLLAYENPEVQCVLHTHSVAATVLSIRHAQANKIRFEGLEMLKTFEGITTHETFYELPIFANSQNIFELAYEQVKPRCIGKSSWGLLLAGHGLYSWGNSVAEAQRHSEAHEFLLQCQLHLEQGR